MDFKGHFRLVKCETAWRKTMFPRLEYCINPFIKQVYIVRNWVEAHYNLIQINYNLYLYRNIKIHKCTHKLIYNNVFQ